jgi:hypothetical protein
MWDAWCAYNGNDDGSWAQPWAAPGGYALSTTNTPAPDDGGGFWPEDAWGLGLTAVAGIAAYEGIRWLIARGRAWRHAATSVKPGPDSHAAPQGGGVSPAAWPAPQAVLTTDDSAPGSAVGGHMSERAEGEADLVDDLIALYDLQPSDALKRRIVRSLAKVGVRTDDARGVAFDAERHDVIGTVGTEAGVEPGTVVEVIRPGFARASGQVVRAAEVVVATDADGAW